LRLSLLVWGILLAADSSVLAQDDWPTRPVRIVLSYAAGGSPDIVARALAQELSDMFGESFVIENRSGGNGNIGADYVAKSAPDGYTLLLGADNQFSISPNIDANLPYQVKDFEPITVVADWHYILVAPPSLEANNVDELIALAKRQGPGKINYASSGVGSTQELAMELLQQLGHFKLTEIPYRGAGQAAPDLVAGRTHLMLTGVGGAIQYLRSGQLKALAIVSPQRDEELPDVPTIAEQGFPNVEAPAYVSLYAPAGTPKDIVLKMQQQTAQALHAPKLRERLLSIGLNPVGSTPEALAARSEKDSQMWVHVLHEMRQNDKQ
jgi:tripartite-type tricarboxylate transporter receptor subunit TctC